jgi:hypothetical protein
MANDDTRLKHLDLKLDNAKKHAAHLQSELQAFLASNPYKVSFKHNPQTRKLIYFVSNADPVPDCLPLIAGDVIQNLRTALDHLAYQIVCSDTGDNPPSPDKIYFPIGDDIAKYESNKRRMLEGATDSTINAIDALKPYKGGNDHVWILHRLNNIEKHRLLLTVGSQAGGINLGQLMAGHLAESFPPEAIEAIESMDVFLNPADKGFPLEAGFELYIGDVDEKPNPKQQFRFDVAINEPGIIEGKPLLHVVNDFIGLVDDIVAALKPLLK